MKYEMKLRGEYFDKIKSGQKIYEIRLNDEKRQQFKVGDYILFRRVENEDDTLDVVIEDLLHFKSFADMLILLPLKDIGFENKTRKEVEDIYHTFYSKEDEEKYKVLAIKVKVV